MKCMKINNQYVFMLKKNGHKLFYNNINGLLGIAEKVEDLKSSFFQLPQDTHIDLNEISYEQLYLVVSESCNFCCKYCRQKKTPELVNMTKEDIKNAIDKFYSVSKFPKSVVFFGGEPLLNMEGIRFAIEYIRKFDKEIKFSMVINGSLCTKEIADFLSKHSVEVIVSIDGPGELHDKARINKGGKGTYRQAIQGYHNLKEAGCKTGISSVIGPHNELYFDRLIDWAIELKPNSLGFCLPHGSSDNFAMQLTSFTDLHKKMINAFEVLHKEKIYLVQVEQKMAAFLLGYTIPHECKACGRRIVACKNKRFGICEGPITVAKMFRDELDQLKPMVYEYRKTSPFYNPECKSCIAYRICGGSCVYDKLTRFGRADIKDECRCGLNRLIAEKAMDQIIDNLTKFDNNYILTMNDRKMLYDKFKIKTDRR